MSHVLKNYFRQFYEIWGVALTKILFHKLFHKYDKLCGILSVDSIQPSLGTLLCTGHRQKSSHESLNDFSDASCQKRWHCILHTCDFPLISDYASSSYDFSKSMAFYTLRHNPSREIPPQTLHLL